MLIKNWVYFFVHIAVIMPYCLFAALPNIPITQILQSANTQITRTNQGNRVIFNRCTYREETETSFFHGGDIITLVPVCHADIDGLADVSVSYCGESYVLKEIPSLHLYLGKNYLTGWHGLSSLNEHLQVLHLEDCHLSEIPDLSPLKHLTTVSIHTNPLSNMNELLKLSNLQNLNLNHCRLTSIPEELQFLENLAYLRIGGNIFEAYSPLGKCTSLSGLELNNSKLRAIPVIVLQLPNLKNLGLANNMLDDFALLTSLINLEQLDLSNNKLRQVPTEISCLMQLQVLWLQYNEMQDFSAINELTSTNHYTRLLDLNLYSNDMISLPVITEGAKIYKLNLQFNPLNSLQQITSLKDRLTHLSLQLHQTISLEEIQLLGELPHIYYLHIMSGPELENVDFLKKLLKLQILALYISIVNKESIDSLVASLPEFKLIRLTEKLNAIEKLINTRYATLESLHFDIYIG